MTNHYWDRVTNSPATVYTPPEDAVIAQPRIPEPGLWGVVRAQTPGGRSSHSRLVRRMDLGETDWQDGAGDYHHWPNLVDPVLIRPGIEDAHCEGHGGPGRWYCCQHPDAGWPCTETVEDES